MFSWPSGGFLLGGGGLRGGFEVGSAFAVESGAGRFEGVGEFVVGLAFVGLGWSTAKTFLPDRSKPKGMA